jgi:ADP-ribosyl-[dinitrogen reductase] hydrolase
LYAAAGKVRGSGCVVESLKAALWALAKSTSFEQGAPLAVNLGDDADTVEGSRRRRRR